MMIGNNNATMCIAPPGLRGRRLLALRLHGSVCRRGSRVSSSAASHQTKYTFFEIKAITHGSHGSHGAQGAHGTHGTCGTPPMMEDSVGSGPQGRVDDDLVGWWLMVLGVRQGSSGTGRGRLPSTTFWRSSPHSPPPSEWMMSCSTLSKYMSICQPSTEDVQKLPWYSPECVCTYYTYGTSTANASAYPFVLALKQNGDRPR
jgi:hypothetical protein